MASFTINGVDVETLGQGLFPAVAPDYLTRPPIEVIGVAIPGRPGRLATNRKVVGSKTFSIAGAIRGTTIANNRSTVRQLHDLFGGGSLISIVGSDQSDVQLFARCTTVKVLPLPQADAIFAIPRLGMEASFETDYPYWQAISASSVSLSGSYVALPMGNAPNYVTWTINACTNPTLTIKNSAGVVVLTVTLTTTIAAGDNRKIIGSERRITKTISGVTTQDDTLLTAGTFPVELKREWGVWATSSWPTAALSATGGTPTGSADYNKSYY